MALVVGATILGSIFALFSSVGKWLVEIAYVYGRKIVLFTVTVSLFFSSLYVIASSITGAIEALSTASVTSEVGQYLAVTVSIMPSNLDSVITLMLSIEFQIFFWKWANKVLNMKVDIFA